MVYNEDKEKTPVTGVLGTTFGGAALAAVTGLLGGNGMGGLFGGGNPSASPIYQLAQKDAEIVQLKAEKYADAKIDSKVDALTKEFNVLSQRVAAIEVAEPLREQNLQMQIGTLGATIARLTQPMIPNANVAYPAPIPMFAIPTPSQGGTTTTPTTTAQAA